MKKLEIMRENPNQNELLELYKKEKNVKLKEKYHALYLMHEFKNCTEVAKIMGLHRSTIIRWVRAFNSKGMDALRPYKPKGRPSRLSEAQLDELKKDVLTHPRTLGYDFSNWEGKTISHHVKKKFGVTLKTRRCQEILHELGFTLQRPRREMVKANEKEQEEFKEELQKKWVFSEKTP